MNHRFGSRLFWVVVCVMAMVFLGGTVGLAAVADFTVEDGVLTAYTGTDTEVTLPSSLGIMTIGANAFAGNATMTSVTLSSAVTAVKSGAFNGCTALTEIHIPGSIPTIASDAFSGVTAAVYCGEDADWVGKTNDYGGSLTWYKQGDCSEDRFSSVTWTLRSDGLLTISGTGSMKSYFIKGIDPMTKNHDIETRLAPWADETVKQVIVESGVTLVGPYSFCQNSDLESISIADSVTTVGSFACYQCTALKEVKLPAAAMLMDGSFYGCTSLTELLIPGGSTFGTWPTGVFTGCTSLKTVYIEDGVTEMGFDTFKNCTSLESVRLPETLESIYAYTFYYCKALTEIYIPDNVTVIASYAFSGCLALKDVHLPDSLKELTENAFAGCQSLEEIEIPAGLGIIGGYVFAACSNLRKVTFLGSTGRASEYGTHYLNKIFDGDVGKVYFTRTEAPNYGGIMTWIRYGTFEDNARWEVDLSENIMTITGESKLKMKLDSTFAGLKKIVVNDGITEITKITNSSTTGQKVTTPIYLPDDITFGSDALTVCSGDPFYVSLDSNTARLLSRNGYTFKNEDYPGLSFQYKFEDEQETGLVLVKAKGDVTSAIIPAGVTEIAEGAFKDCESLISVIIPDTITAVGDSAFSKCTSLTEVNLGNSVTSLGNSAFSSCTALKEIVLPKSVSRIGNYAFSNCTQLTHVECNGSLETIGEKAFYNCSSLESIILTGASASIEKETFRGCSKLESVTLSGIFKAIKDNAFYECGSLRKVELSEGLEEIGSAFQECGALEEINFPSSLRTIGQQAFMDDTSLKSVVFPEGLQSIGRFAFGYCSGLKEVSLPDSLTSMGDSVFYLCGALNSLRLSAGLEEIPEYSLLQSGLSSVEIPAGVRVIGSSAFSGSKSLTEITFPESLEKIGNGAFSSCPIQTAILYNGIKSIGNYALSAVKVVYLLDEDILESVSDSSFGADTKIYCYEYSGADACCTEAGYDVIYLDGLSFVDYGTISLPEEESILVGETLQLKADVDPILPGQTLTWTSDSEEIVTVDQDGLVTALGRGTAVITVSLDGAEAIATITTIQYISDFTIPEELYVVAKETIQAKILATVPEAADTDFVWSMEENRYAKTDESGLVSGKLAGDAQLTVTDRNTGISKTAAVHVCYPVTGVTLSPESLTLLKGETAQLTARVTARNENYINQLVAFTSDDPTIAMVDNQGMVSAIMPGTTLITVSASSGKSASLEVTVQCVEHEPVIDPMVAPTFTEPGMSEGSHCAACGETIVAQQTILELNELTVMIIPIGVERIEEEAFAGISSQAIIIPAGCIAVESKAFSDCEELLYVYIPGTVTELAEDAFEGCAKVTIDRGE